MKKALVYVSILVEFEDDGVYEIEEQAYEAAATALSGVGADWQFEKIVLEKEDAD